MRRCSESGGTGAEVGGADWHSASRRRAAPAHNADAEPAHSATFRRAVGSSPKGHSSGCGDAAAAAAAAPLKAPRSHEAP